MEPQATSPSFALNSFDWKKIGKGALIAAAGAVLTYLSTFITHADFGVYTAVVAVVASALINAGQKWVSSNSQ